MYRFCKTAPLPTLKVSGENDILVFATPTERATVTLSADGNIASVIHADLVSGSETTIPTADSHHIVVGAGNWERDVYHYLKPCEQSHLQLRLGITMHRGTGTWSSLPHDFENAPEAGFEEVFFYLLEGTTQKAIQVGRGLWEDGASVDEVWPVSNREFSAVPMGYHPVVGEPGVNVKYVWAYLAKKQAWEKI